MGPGNSLRNRLRLPGFFFFADCFNLMTESSSSAPNKRKRSTYERALDMLEARARGVAELRRLLIKKGEPEADVDDAIGRLCAAGVLDDANFARQLTRSKALGAGLARRRIQQELSKRGVAREISDDAIEQVFDEEGVDEEASIERVARKKMRMLTRVDSQTRKRRLYAFLARRGYDADDIQRALRVVLADVDAEADVGVDTDVDTET
jgi:regulatory protein